MAIYRRFGRLLLVVAACLLASLFLLSYDPRGHAESWQQLWGGGAGLRSSFDWSKRQPAHPIDESTMTPLPAGSPHTLRRVQYDFSRDHVDEHRERIRLERREAVRNAARKSWASYRKYAWGFDELRPQSLVGANTFNGWGATLVDSLDTLWIMGLDEEFREAVQVVGGIDWDRTTSSVCSVFETNIRYLGGLLAAYDLSGEPILLAKAVELGNMLYAAFDTPNHLPVNSFNFTGAKRGALVADKRESSAAVGSLSLEFTRLSQLTGDPKFFSAIDRIKREFERTQSGTSLPGVWPMFIDLQNGFLTPGTVFSLGAMADSAYEYLGKMYALLGGRDPVYQKLHMTAMTAIKEHMLFRPMLPDAYPEAAPDVLFPGTVLSNGNLVERTAEVQHLACFAGGMFALGGRLFDDDEHVAVGERLARGCAWAYGAFPTGIMPEVAELIPCDDETPGEDDDDDHLAPCAWNETRWRRGRDPENIPHPRGFAALRDARYFLRPEAIESVFVLYRITGKKDLQDIAWRMFEAIRKSTETSLAHCAIADVRVPGSTKVDSMESFWIAETLKYFYLIFSEPDLISLDDYIFNTEAHPLKIPKPTGEEGDAESEED